MDEHLGKKLLYAASSVTHIKRFHLDVISALRRDGYAVETLARGADADRSIPFEKRLFSLKNLLLVPRIRKILKNGGYDAVLLNTSLASFFVRLACPRRDRPRTVNIVHGYLFSDKIHSPKALILRLAEEILRGKTDVIITMNRTDADIARKFRLAREGTLEIPGMGVTLRREITSPEEIRRKFFPEDAYVITFVGELSKRKNQALLETFPHFHLLFPKFLGNFRHLYHFQCFQAFSETFLKFPNHLPLLHQANAENLNGFLQTF